MGENKFINNNLKVFMNTSWTPQWSMSFRSI